MKTIKEIEKVFNKDNTNIAEELREVVIKNNLNYNMSAFFETETHLHIHKVALFSLIIAKELKLKKEDMILLKQIAPLHDIGKLLIPNEILSKPSKLTKAEFDVIKNHANLGYEILKDCTHKSLKLASLIALEHHEKFDGTGYPMGMKGEETHLYSRIIALADVIESLASVRCYKKAWKKEDVRKLVEEQSGKHFDPVIAAAALKNFDKFFE